MAEPIAYTTEEGGEYLPWVTRDECVATKGARRNAKAANAIIFDDGMVFEMFHGWREKLSPDAIAHVKRVVTDPEYNAQLKREEEERRLKWLARRQA